MVTVAITIFSAMLTLNVESNQKGKWTFTTPAYASFSDGESSVDPEKKWVNTLT